ncbi:polyphosphate kinase 1 [Gammaproteobacteria bacterium]|nr:polyphosphate kinase 1 [Gammaproteobacteria bacterium]
MKQFVNRELSWIAFNERVLQEAKDQTVPLLQRLRFLGICSNNQDEFIKVRFANLLRANATMRTREKKTTGNITHADLLPKVVEQLAEMRQKFAETYHNIFKEMEDKGIFMLDETQLNKEQKDFCRRYYSTIISPRLIPLVLHRQTQLPFLSDQQVYLGVKMKKGKNSQYAIIQIPISSECPRFVVLPQRDPNRTEVVFIDDIIRLCLDDIFFMFNYKSIEAYTFKFLRDAHFDLQEDVSKSLLEKMSKGVKSRTHGKPIRLVYDKNMPSDLVQLIINKLNLKVGDSIDMSGRYHMLRHFIKFPRVNNELESQLPKPIKHSVLSHKKSVLEAILKQDIFLNYPYHSFNHFIDFLREAAIDPHIQNIYITLYRTADHSKVINALINAAKNGKHVLVLVELKARFDEEQNIQTTTELQNAGVKVLQGIDTLKVHSKVVLVERKENNTLQRYSYIGTGNFNEDTAPIYSDFGFFTSNKTIGNDLKELFNFLQINHLRFECKQLLVAPYYLRDQFSFLIQREIENAQKGKPAYIKAKMNSLTDTKIIELLYKASLSGVKIQLLVRGACCLIPGKEFSENIQLKSLIDIYLEHARVYIFCNNNKEEIFTGSADWMTRNLDRRVEVITPITDSSIQNTLQGFFDIQWNDTTKARQFNSNNQHFTTENKDQRRAQLELYNYYKTL